MLGIWGGSLGIAQDTQLKVDTLIISQPNESVFLNHPFVIDTTFFLFYKSTLVDSFLLDPIAGSLVVTKSFDYPATFIATYQSLRDTLPLQVGPLFYSFPNIDSLLIEDRKKEKFSIKNTDTNLFPSPSVISSGTIYRNVNISPLGGTDFSGGIRMSLDGKLSDNMTISGVLTDQNLPFQSDGSTQTLSEVDKIYLHVDHPKFSVKGGDITFNKNYGRFLNINKNMIGLNNRFRDREWTGNFILGGEKGTYHSMLFFGSDQNQGPYFLLSRSGDRNIVVIAGSESVWLEGEKLTRGRNNDYTIDYNTAEISFTPKRLIHFDSEIFIEYEYSDFNYNSDFLGCLLQYEKSAKKNISVAWIKEEDKFNNETINLNDAERDSLNAIGDGDFILSTALIDTSGNYILHDEIFKYEKGESVDKYSVQFYYDEDGNYIRKVAPNGIIFYEYISDNLKTDWNDYYSPLKKLPKPVKKNYYHVLGNYPVSEKGYTQVEIAVSQTDLNTQSSADDKDNTGLAYNFGLGFEKITLFENLSFNFNSNHWRRDRNFHSIQNNHDVEFYSKWNIVELTEGFEQLTEGALTLNLHKAGFLKTSLAEFENSNTVKQQFLTESEFSFKYIPELKSNLNIVRSPSENFYSSDNQFVFMSGGIHPFLELDLEGLEENYSFKHVKGGIFWDKKNRKMKLSFGKRDDFRIAEEINIVSKTGELRIEQSSYSGWNGIIHLITRQVDSEAENPNMNYVLGDVRIRYNQRSNPVKWEGFFRLEESMTESKTVVYDSIGSGLGNYRYDQVYDSYFEDPNGAFIAYTVPTGIRDPSTHFTSSQTWNFRFSKKRKPILRFGRVRIISQMDFRGKRLGLNKLINFNIDDSETQLAKFLLKSEYIYRPLGTESKGKLWHFYQQSLSGIDSRGARIQKDNKLGLEWDNPLNENYQVVHYFTLKQTEVVSQYNTSDDRTIISAWAENGVNTIISNAYHLNILATLGRANGVHGETNYISNAAGIKAGNTIFFGKKNRGEISLEWTRVTISNPSIGLPPEAFNGLAEGVSFRCGGFGRFALGQNIYMQIDVNLINNKRYDNLVNINAEIRSHF